MPCKSKYNQCSFLDLTYSFLSATQKMPDTHYQKDAEAQTDVLIEPKKL